MVEKMSNHLNSQSPKNQNTCHHPMNQNPCLKKCKVSLEKFRNSTIFYRYLQSVTKKQSNLDFEYRYRKNEKKAPGDVQKCPKIKKVGTFHHPVLDPVSQNPCLKKNVKLASKNLGLRRYFNDISNQSQRSSQISTLNIDIVKMRKSTW